MINISTIIYNNYLFIFHQQYSKKDMEKFKQQLINYQENNQDLKQRLHKLQGAQKKELPKLLKAESVVSCFVCVWKFYT